MSPTRSPLEVLASIEALVDLIPAGVAIIGSEGSTLFANDHARRLLGASDGVSEVVTRVLAGETIHEERLDAHVGAERRAVEVSGTPIHRGNGELIGAALLLRDVTVRERRSRAERDFVTNAAHELQTPIAAITSAIEVLQRGAKNRRAERDRFLEHIEHAVERLTRLTQALLILARVQAGVETPRLEVVPLKPLLRTIADRSLGGNKIEVSCASDLAVIANEPLLEQALVNLGQNALKYAPGRIALTAERDDGTVTIHVRDEGPGIAPADAELVFDRFYRTDQAGGFGLGLAIVRETVEALGGGLELDSGPDGTCVSISLRGARLR